MKKNYVLVDICGTLYDANTTMTFLDFIFQSNKRYRIFRFFTRFILIRALNLILLKVFNYDFIRYSSISFLRGKNKKEIENMVNVYYNNFLHDKILLEPITIIKHYINNNNYRIVIVSATLDCIANKVAMEMGIDEIISSKLMYNKDNICLGKLETDILNNKLSELINSGYVAPYSFTISDNFSDANLMKLSYESCIVTNKKKIKKWKKIIINKHIKNYKICIVK